MVEGIINLTRKVLPKLSPYSKHNLESLNSMPEMVLAKMIRNGDKSIIHTDMNQCKAAIISKDGITTSYTDALNGCNSVGAVLQLKDGRKLCIQSHYVPTNISGQTNAVEKQLQTYEKYIDQNYRPKVFFNIRGYDDCGKLSPVPNPIVDTIKDLFNKLFAKGADFSITPYQNQERPAFFSSANIFQFNPNNTNQLKITNVGEQEKFIDLTI